MFLLAFFFTAIVATVSLASALRQSHPVYGSPIRNLRKKTSIASSPHKDVSQDYLKLIGIGACGEVGRSCFLLTSPRVNLLLDCGIKILAGSGNESPDLSRVIDPSEINAIVITHAHIDHYGYLPNVVAMGFCGTIFGTSETRQIIVANFKDPNTFNLSPGEIERILNHWEDVSPGMVINDPACDLTLRFWPAGHILGAVMVEIEHGGKRILYSGDLGGESLTVDPYELPAKDYDLLIVESTYGGKRRPNLNKEIRRLVDSINETISQGGIVVIPCFAIDRAQTVLTILGKAREENLLDPSVPIYVDGLIKEINAIYARSWHKGPNYLTSGFTEIHSHPERMRILGLSPPVSFAPGLGRMDEDEEEEEDEEEKKEVGEKETPFSLSITTAEPMRRYPGNRNRLWANLVPEQAQPPEPAIIVTTSGMVEGLADFYLRNLGQDDQHMVILTGYQAPGSKGSMLESGHYDLDEGTFELRTKKCNFSAHADEAGLTDFVRSVNAQKTLLVHGESESIAAFSAKLSAEGRNVQPMEQYKAFMVFGTDPDEEGVARQAPASLSPPPDEPENQMPPPGLPRLPQFSQGGIVHSSVPLGLPQDGDVHLHSWYNEDGSLRKENLTGQLPGYPSKHIALQSSSMAAHLFREPLAEESGWHESRHDLNRHLTIKRTDGRIAGHLYPDGSIKDFRGSLAWAVESPSSNINAPARTTKRGLPSASAIGSAALPLEPTPPTPSLSMSLGVADHPVAQTFYTAPLSAGSLPVEPTAEVDYSLPKQLNQTTLVAEPTPPALPLSVNTTVPWEQNITHQFFI